MKKIISKSNTNNVFVKLARSEKPAHEINWIMEDEYQTIRDYMSDVFSAKQEQVDSFFDRIASLDDDSDEYDSELEADYQSLTCEEMDAVNL